jgi:hypothetical protein
VELALAELTETVTVPLLEPEEGDTVSQSALSVIVQDVFEVISNVPLDPETGANETVAGDIERIMVPVWVMVTVWSVAPEAETVTVAIRSAAFILTELAVTVIVKLPEPEAEETVSQSALSVIVQDVFEVIINVPFDPDAAANKTIAGDTESATPTWVTVTV